MPDNTMHDLGRLGITVDGAGGLTATNLTGTNVTATNINGAAALTPTSSATLSNKTLDASVIGGTTGALATGSYSQATNTTLANVTGLVTPTLTAGGKYLISGYLATTNNGTGGIKLAWAAGGGLTATSFLQDTWVYNTTTVTGQGNITSLASNMINAAIAATAVEFTATLQVNVAGTLQLQAAQNTSNGTALTIANNSYITITRIG